MFVLYLKTQTELKNNIDIDKFTNVSNFFYNISDLQINLLNHNPIFHLNYTLLLYLENIMSYKFMQSICNLLNVYN